MATRGDLPLQFSWLLNNSPIEASLPNIKIMMDDFSSHISISSLTEAHDATYTCSVSNEGGSVKHSARLQVNIYRQSVVLFISTKDISLAKLHTNQVNVPPRWVERPTNSSGIPGERLEIRCRTSGRPSPGVSWADIQY